MAPSGRDGGGNGDVPRRRVPSRWGDLSRVVEHLPALRAGRLVRAGGQAALAWQGVPHSLRGRLRYWVYPRGRCPPGAGRFAAAIQQVRLGDPSGQNPAPLLSATAFGGLRAGHGVGQSAWDVHFIGFHPLLGAFLAGYLYGEAQDGFESVESGVAEHRPVGSAAPAPAARRTTANTGPEATRTLRVLRHHRQQSCVVAVPYWGRASLALLAQPPESAAVARLGSFQSSVAAVSAAADESGPLGVRSRSESMIGGTVCTNACTYGSVGALGGQPPGATRPHLFFSQRVSRLLVWPTARPHAG